jgi:hypothetical protein
MLVVAVGAVAASANVERYQGVDYELTITSVNANPGYTHDFNIQYDPYLESCTGSGIYSSGPGTETVSDCEGTEDSLSFRSDYDDDDYTWYPSFTLNDGDLTLTFIDGFGDDNVTAAEGTYTAAETEYENHGQYVRDAEDKKNAAHSLIGMPTTSKKNK